MDWLRYLITGYEPSDVPQVQMMGFMQSLLAEEMLTSPMVNTTAISDAGLAKRTLYELDRSSFTRETYDRAVNVWMRSISKSRASFTKPGVGYERIERNCLRSISIPYRW